MLLNLLAKVNKMDPIPGGLYTFILGILVVFLGIAIIVVFVTIAGKIFNASENKVKVPKQKVEPIKEEVVNNAPVVDDGEIPEHVKVAIVAAISAYYEEAKSNCDFVVKKIRRF